VRRTLDTRATSAVTLGTGYDSSRGRQDGARDRRRPVRGELSASRRDVRKPDAEVRGEFAVAAIGVSEERWGRQQPLAGVALGAGAQGVVRHAAELAGH
jgi:hypothetical protein